MNYVIRHDGHFKWVRLKGHIKEYPYPPGNKEQEEKAFKLAREYPDGKVINLKSIVDEVPQPEIRGTGMVLDKDGKVKCHFRLGN